MSALQVPRVTVPEGQCGDYAVEHFTITDHDALKASLSYGHRAPPPGTYTRLMHRGHVLMSDTPAEMMDHHTPIRQARTAKTVLINGLGLGLVLQACLQYPTIEHITVIEIAPEVITLVAPTYQSDSRVIIIQADALTWQPPRGAHYDVVWHDIWPFISDANLPAMHHLHRKYGRRAGWQGSWSRGAR